MRAHLRNAFIATFLLLQLLLPLRFYACGDGYDERFSWRMFSPTRMVRCEYAFTADGRQLRLSERFHQAWLNLARRGRKDVIDGIAAKLCADKEIEKVTVRLKCESVAGITDLVSDGESDRCAKGAD